MWDATCQIKHTWRGHLDCLQRTESRPAHDPQCLAVQQAPQGTGLHQEEHLLGPGPAPGEGTFLTSSLSAPPRHHRTPCPPGKQMLSTKTQQRKLLGDVVLSLVLKTTYRRGKLRLLLVAQPKGAKATQKEDPQGSKNQAKLRHKAGCLGLLVVFMGSSLDGFGHPAPEMEQEQQQSPNFML